MVPEFTFFNTAILILILEFFTFVFPIQIKDYDKFSLIEICPK